IDLGRVAPGESNAVRVRLANRGPTGARGRIASAVPWLEVSPTEFGLGPNTELDLVLRPTGTDRLPPRRRHTGRITITTDGGQGLQVTALMDLRPASPAPAASAPTARPRAGAQGSVRATQPSAATQRRPANRTGLVLLLLAAALAAAIGGTYVYQDVFASPERAVARGLAALEEGNWRRAASHLARMDPSDAEGVRRVAERLDEEMVFVPGGTLQMGSEESLAADQKPVHPVPVADYSMDRFPVTNVQYQRFANQTGRRPPAYWRGGRFAAGEALRPVVGITWDDALAYAAWAGKRLPTEAEWEWAARGPEGRLFPWGDEPDASRANSKELDLGRTTDVGSYPHGATPLGIMDLAGNVREWTADRYGAYRVPHAPPSEGDDIAVRGSSWRTYNDVASAREKVARDDYADDLGFRCVR
ncbi:MAG: formylglycine-generating enzyme family protein, partial [Chloroflexi bacterium]|nr:formylglycine-generating enzyme family protein [Chloroflexota bacterium]